MRAVVLAALLQLQLQPYCLERGEMLWRMANVYRETVADWGITSSGVVIEFWRGGSGTWTLLVSTARQSCIAFHGGGGREI
jgi:hypothetical protein